MNGKKKGKALISAISLIFCFTHFASHFGSKQSSPPTSVCTRLLSFLRLQVVCQDRVFVSLQENFEVKSQARLK
jgi:hypothetical protein